MTGEQVDTDLKIYYRWSGFCVCLCMFRIKGSQAGLCSASINSFFKISWWLLMRHPWINNILFWAELYPTLAQTSSPSTIFPQSKHTHKLSSHASDSVNGWTFDVIATRTSVRRSLWTSLPLSNLSNPLIQHSGPVLRTNRLWVGRPYIPAVALHCSVFCFPSPCLIPLFLPLFLMHSQDIPDVG